MTAWRLNTIATRLALTILLAITLGIMLEVIIAFVAVYSGQRSGVRVIAAPSAVYIFSPRREPVFSFSTTPSPEMLAGKVATAVSLIEAAPQADRLRIVTAMRRPDLQIYLRDEPVAGLPDTRTLLRRLTEIELGGRPVRVNFAPRDLTVPDDGSAASGRPTLLIQTPLSDGRWALVATPDYVLGGHSRLRLLFVVIPFAMLIGLLSTLAARRFAAPITQFVRGAERLGVDTTAPPLVESGPDELRAATRAFNRMQERLRRFVEDRTQMLAAMSHDLRTPLNRLRLRAELIEDEEQQRKMFADLEAMSIMIESTLAFVRDDRAREPRKLVDLGVLVEDVCEDASDAGGSVSYSGPKGVNIRCRPMAVARAVANLVDNAIKYGGGARVCLLREAEHVVIAVEDDGPGIPPGERERVFTPFYRLEPSRNPATGGVGLGLSVARTVAREHGGDVRLANRAEGGLCARMELPVA